MLFTLFMFFAAPGTDPRHPSDFGQFRTMDECLRYGTRVANGKINRPYHGYMLCTDGNPADNFKVTF